VRLCIQLGTCGGNIEGVYVLTSVEDAVGQSDPCRALDIFELPALKSNTLPKPNIDRTAVLLSLKIEALRKSVGSKTFMLRSYA
jgi:hypothetical protein